MNERGISAGANTLLGQVRDLFAGNSVVLTSGARNTSRNSQIKGASRTSQHLDGDAFDFVVKGANGRLLPNAVVADKIRGSGIQFQQLITETGAGGGPRVHLGVGTRGQILDASDSNVVRYGRRYVDVTGRGSYREAITRVLGNNVGNKVADTLKSGADAVAKGGDAIAKSTSFIEPLVIRGVIGIIGLVFIIAAVVAVNKMKGIST